MTEKESKSSAETTALQLQLKLLSCEYSTTSKQFALRVFLPRKFKAADVVAVDVKIGEPLAVTLTLPLKLALLLPANTPLHIWLDAERPVIEDRFVDGKDAKDNSEVDRNPFSPRAPQTRHGMVRIGAARFSLLPHQQQEATVYHLSGHAAARIQCTLASHKNSEAAPDPAYAWCSQLEFMGHVRSLAERPWTTATDAYVEAVQTTSSRYRDSNIRELARTSCSRVELPCGDVPLWAFVWAPTQGRTYDSAEFEALLLWWLHVACVAMRVDPKTVDEAAELPVVLELYGEMLAVLPRACLYAPDSFTSDESHENEDYDQWTYFDHAPVPSMHCYDCEDGAGFVHGLSHAVRDSGSDFKDKRLLRMQQLERRYFTFMALGTLAIADADGHVGHVYHAYTLKLDKQYVRACLTRGGATASKEEETKDSKSQPLLPPLLIESSGYSVSCWQYNDREEERIKCFRASEIKVPMPARRKVPVTLLRESGRYVHTQTLVCAELTEQESVGQIEIIYRGAIACPTEVLMEYDSAVSMVPVLLTAGTDKAAVLGAMEHMPGWKAPKLPKIQNTTPKELQEMLAGEALKPVPRLDCWFRGRDWNDSMGLRNLVSHKATKATIQLTDQVTVVRMTLDS